MNGADYLINHLNKNQIQMSICSGSSSKEFFKKIKKCKKLIEMVCVFY
jgi:hypothetical protein